MTKTSLPPDKNIPLSSTEEPIGSSVVWGGLWNMQLGLANSSFNRFSVSNIKIRNSSDTNGELLWISYENKNEFDEIKDAALE